MEEEAEYANRHGFSRHEPALPLFDGGRRAACARSLRPAGLRRRLRAGTGVSRALLAAPATSWAPPACASRPRRRSVLFSGDLGRADDELMQPPTPPPASRLGGRRVHLRQPPAWPGRRGAGAGRRDQAYCGARRHRPDPVVRGRPRADLAAPDRQAQGRGSDSGPAGLPEQPDGGRRDRGFTAAARRAPPGRQRNARACAASPGSSTRWRNPSASTSCDFPRSSSRPAAWPVAAAWFTT